jgi:hypothetical protein
MAVSGLETLPPDQRAVMQLILVQGRGYADLAATLRLDAAAVRERAHAGASALGLPGADDVDPDTRGRIVDYLLGQQDDGERIVTFAELGASPAACRWAQELRAQLASVASVELPEVPASATAAVTNGSGASSAPAIAPAPAAFATAPTPAAAPVATAAAPAAPAPAASRAAPPSPPATDGPSAPTGGPSGPRPSRLGGAILIGGAAVLAIVLAIVLIGGDDNPSSPSGSTNSAQTQTSTTAASRQAAARTVGGAVLRATSSGGSAFGAALVQQTTNGRRLLAVEVARLPGNGAQEIYAIWLQGAAGNKFLGFVPNQVRANGTFTVSSALPRSVDLSAYSTVLVTSEGTSAVPSTPGTAVASGPLRLAG